MKVAIVTGVSRGLGESLARLALASGFAVTGVGRSSAATLSGPSYQFCACDLSDIAAIDATLAPVFSGLAAQRPAFVCLINNAAVAGPVGTLGALENAAVHAAITANLVAPVAIANLFCRSFAAPSSRRIINVSSGAADSPLSGGGPYSIAKAGLEMLTRQLAAEHDSATFRAISVRPGVIDTGMQTFMRTQSPEILPSVELFKEFHRDQRLVPPDVVASKIIDRLVLGDVEQGRTYNYREL